MAGKGVLIDSPIETKIEWAENCRREMGAKLLRDRHVSELLGKLQRALGSSREAMAAAGVTRACADCEKLEGGSCCGIGLENRYSGILLLINLLMGVEMPSKRRQASCCFFLGAEGCLLLARDVICVNYLCARLTRGIPPKKIIALQEKEGEALTLLFSLNEHIRKRLGNFIT